MAGLGFLIFRAQEQGWGCGEESSPRMAVPGPSWPQMGAGVLLADLWTRGQGSWGGAARLRGGPWAQSRPAREASARFGRDSILLERESCVWQDTRQTAS